MNAKEKVQLLASLDESRKALVNSLNGVAPETALRAPSPGAWTICDCVEHVAISEDYLFAQIGKAQRCDAPLVNARREELIPVRGLDRSRRIECPEDGLPKGRFPTLAAALEHFLSSRDRTVRFVESIDAGRDLRAEITTHPVLGAANCYEMLLTMAVHPRRHALQIEEIKAALG
jgi:hypothetical protein